MKPRTVLPPLPSSPLLPLTVASPSATKTSKSKKKTRSAAVPSTPIRTAPVASSVIPTEKKSSVKQIPRDVIEMMTNNLSPQDLINMCASDARPDFKYLCDSNDFWIRRWEKDFKFFMSSSFYNKTDAKNKYLQMFAAISKGSEGMVKSIFEQFGDFGKFLNKEYKDTLYNFFYKQILNTLYSLLMSNIEISEDEIYEIPFGGVDFKEFKKILPEFVRDDRGFFNDYWSDVLSEISNIILRINRELHLFKMEEPIIVNSTIGSPRLPPYGRSHPGSPRLPPMYGIPYGRSPPGSPRL